MTKRRVVVTGLGMITPVGHSVNDTWSAIRQGKSGVSPITHFDATDSPTKIAALVKDFDPSDRLDVKKLRKIDPFACYALYAANEALKDANVNESTVDLTRAGVAVGAGIGGISSITESINRYNSGGPRKVSPFFIPSSIINMAAGHISIENGLKGPNISIVTACTTGTHNIGHAARIIQHGDADVMVAGGTEAASTPVCIAGFATARALSRRNDEPTKASRPWDKERDGFILGDGSGILILEEYEHAKKRGAKIYGEIVGFGMSADAHHITSPDQAGFVACMSAALRDADIAKDQVDYVNAHGTSTPAGDVVECQALKEVFGDHAYNLAVSSTKSMIGHLLGAAGAVEAIFSLLAIRDNVAPPTINLDNPEDGCDLNFVPHEAQSREITTVLSNSFGFGGTNGTLIFSQVDG